MRTGEPNDNKKKDRKNTMTKERYMQFIHATKDAETLKEIIIAALNDTELSHEDFFELVNEKKEIIMKERR